MDKQRRKYLNLIKKLLKIAKRENILNTIYSDSFYNDEPKSFSFSCLLKTTNKLANKSSPNISGGSSFIKEKALLKALGEAFERYNLAICPKTLIESTYKDLKTKAIDPRKFISFSNPRITPNFKIYKDESDRLKWIRGLSLIKRKNIFVPAQLVFVPYHFGSTEPVIRFPISTGAACYTSLEETILRGLLEVIERDAFMIFYLNKLSPNMINIRNSQDKILKEISASIERYNLEFYVLDISTDVPVYSILAVIVDKTGLGPAISLGMKSDLNLKSAIVGAVEEGFHSRFWIRDTMIKEFKNLKKEIYRKKYYISDLKERGLLWSELQMINKIKFFLNGKKISIENLSLKKTKNLDTLLKWFKKRNIEVIYVDITLPNLRRKNIYVGKVLIPEFQPLYLDERFPYWEGRRLKEVPQKLGFNFPREINKFPHPFL